MSNTKQVQGDTADCRQQQFIFLAGLHRSGTSLIHRIIRDHPQVSGLKDTGVPEDEGQHLQDVFPTAKALGGPGKFVFNQGAYMDENHPLVSRDNAQRVYETWLPFLDLPNTYIVEKSPPNIIRTRFLQALYPNSKFVFIFRHPLAVAYATQKWSRTSIRDLTEHCLKAYAIAVDDAKQLSQVHFIQYEKFVQAPIEETAALFQFLDLPETTIKQDIKANINQKYFQQWDEENNAAGYKQFLQIFKPLPRSMEKAFNRFGYSFDAPERLVPIDYGVNYEAGNS